MHNTFGGIEAVALFRPEIPLEVAAGDICTTQSESTIGFS
jgi:hypothetical protein